MEDLSLRKSSASFHVKDIADQPWKVRPISDFDQVLQSVVKVMVTKHRTLDLAIIQDRDHLLSLRKRTHCLLEISLLSWFQTTINLLIDGPKMSPLKRTIGSKDEKDSKAVLNLAAPPAGS